ncbi:MAG: CinA family protein [Gammaproteobacteria bacterium]|nr:CinA family protein [Gammaproteobacteria bacterium]
MEEDIERLARRVGIVLSGQGYRLATAESCTGGGIAAAVTSVPGSSNWFERGFVTYSNAAKRELLGVREATLVAHGAVSEATVREMAAGALGHGAAQVAVAVSGIAGPGGGSAEKPIGTVCLAWDGAGLLARSETRYFHGDRAAVRRQAVAAALAGVIEIVGQRHGKR